MIKTTYFAAGCFWGVQDYFDQVPGVVETFVGYCGGITVDPTYEEVCEHQTGHAETVKINYQTDTITFKDLCYQFFYMHDPTQLNCQGYDIGDNYRSAIFIQNNQETEIVQQVINTIANNFSKPIVTQISKFDQFYLAEEYHQNYAKKNHVGSCHVAYKEIVVK